MQGKDYVMLGDRVLIRPLEAKSGSGLIINNTKEKPEVGVVVLVGPGTKDVEMLLQEGNEVLFGKYSGLEVELEEGKFLSMRQDDVIMITKK